MLVNGGPLLKGKVKADANSVGGSGADVSRSNSNTRPVRRPRGRKLWPFEVAVGRWMKKGNDQISAESLVFLGASATTALARFENIGHDQATVQSPTDAVIDVWSWWARRASIGVGDGEHAQVWLEE